MQGKRSNVAPGCAARVGLAALLAAGLVAAPAGGGGAARADVFEVVHPEIEAGGFELEVLNSVVLGGVAHGDTRSVHEFALGYAPVWFWKPTVAIEVANPQGESAEVEAFAFENLFLLPLGRGAPGIADGHGHDGHGHDPGYALGVYAVLEVPNEGGIGRGTASVGPVGELSAGPLDLVGNLFLDIPFEDGVDPGLSYAVSASTPLSRRFSLGAEAHGAVDEAFGHAPPLDRQEHFIGPALYGAFDLGLGRMLEPRAALLFGWTDAAPDAVLSVNLELKF